MLVCLLAAGCASVTVPRGSAATALSSVSPAVSSVESNPPSSSSASPASSAGPLTLQSDGIAAADEATALLAALQVPPGAEELATAPAEVSVPWLVERRQSWQIPMGFETAVAWERSHPPAGTELFDEGNGSGPGPSDRSVSLDYVPTTSSPAWSDGKLALEVVSGTPTVSYLRVDAAAAAIDPAPYSDVDTDPRVRATVAGGCPDGNSNGAANQGADLSTLMVPVAAPRAGLLCEYAGDNQSSDGTTPHQLVKAIPLDAELAAKIAHQIAQVPLGHVDGEGRSCPAGGFGPVPVLALSYADRPDVDVWGSSGACSWIANGRILITGEDLAASVEALVNPSATVAQ